MTHSSTNNKRNSLIELYRFLFALNVVIGHGLFPVDIEYFGPDRASVEFFFVLSGFLFCKSLDKYEGMSLLPAVKGMLISKIKPILIPTIIGIVCNIILNYITKYNPFKVFRYLWYIPAMLAAFLLYTILRVLIKNEKKFWIIVGTICLIATLLRFSGNETLFFFDFIRSAIAVSLGMLVARIPKFEVKRKIVWWIALVPVAFAIFYIVFHKLATVAWFGGFMGIEAILNLILYPALVYITFNIDFHFSIFNYLGALSFGIYAFQCPARLIDAIGVPSRWIPFALIFVLAIGEDAIKRIIKHFRNKKV